MEEGNERIEQSVNDEKGKNFSTVARAGKRTYFFDIKSTRNEDFYVTITESKKRVHPDGHPYYEKHKIFLYREDFAKFSNALSTMLEYVEKNFPANHSHRLRKEFEYQEGTNENLTEEYEEEVEEVAIAPDAFSNIDFEDLDSKH